MQRLPEKYENLLKAALNSIRKEIDRCYWNANQKEMTSPFDNTGAPDFSTEYFTVRAYDWGEEENEKPNFETKEMQVFWYKHSNRGVVAHVPSTTTNYAELITEILNNALKSIEPAFKKKK